MTVAALSKTRRPLRVGAAVLAAVLATALIPGRVAGDWLVTQEGGRVETKGPWKVKGKLVVFTAKDGKLASLRLIEVDLPASEQATRDAVAAEAKRQQEEAAPPPPAPKRKSVRSVTDADVGHVDPAALAAAKEAKEKAQEKPDAAPERPKPGNSVSVSHWDRKDMPGKEGVEVFGTLKNDGMEIATSLRLTVTLFDEAKETLATDDAVLDATVLKPGGTMPFVIQFAGVFAFADAKFDIQSLGLKIKPAEPQPPPAEGQAPPP